MTTKIALLGSTGSIGTQTLDVVRAHPGWFSVDVLCAANNWELLAAQAREFRPRVVVIANEMHYARLRDALLDLPQCEVRCGMDAVESAATEGSHEVVVVAIVGFAGLAPTIAAIKAGKRIALANKECLVVGGDIIMPLARKMGVDIMPVDSEHSAIFQCLVGELTPPKRLILTASGGALRDMSIDEIQNVSPQRVMQHPTWDMGTRITVDSATMLNKGFEVIEAAHLFGMSGSQIQVVIHPQSIIHSAVEFDDNAIKAQLSYPDMRLAIQYALTYPERMEVKGLQSFDPFVCSNLSFQKPDPLKYPCLELSYHALREGGLMPTVLNAAGEIAVENFVREKIHFTQIAQVIEHCLGAFNNREIGEIGDLFETDANARHTAQQYIKSI